MDQTTTTTTETAVPALIAGMLDQDSPQALVDAYLSAEAAGRPELAAQVARFAGVLGQELRAHQARLDEDVRHSHESSHDEIWAEQDVAGAGLSILKSIPALEAAIECLDDEEKAAIWAAHGPYRDDPDDEEA
jgi:hypothetical protein